VLALADDKKGCTRVICDSRDCVQHDLFQEEGAVGGLQIVLADEAIVVDITLLTWDGHTLSPFR